MKKLNVSGRMEIGEAYYYLMNKLHEYEKTRGDVIVTLDTPGGDVIPALNVANRMLDIVENGGSVTTEVVGQCQSAGVYIFLGGNIRHMRPSTALLIHPPIYVNDNRRETRTVLENKAAYMNNIEIMIGEFLSRVENIHKIELDIHKSLCYDGYDVLLTRNEARLRGLATGD